MDTAYFQEREKTKVCCCCCCFFLLSSPEDIALPRIRVLVEPLSTLNLLLAKEGKNVSDV